jgi:Alcohol dehydrogenase GroES-associated
MRATVFRGPFDVRIEQVPDAALHEPTVFDRQTDLTDDNLIDSDERVRYRRPCSP